MLVTQIAEAEGIGRSQACRVLRLTLFAPDIVERILDARLGAGSGAADEAASACGKGSDRICRAKPEDWGARPQEGVGVKPFTSRS